MENSFLSALNESGFPFQKAVEETVRGVLKKLDQDYYVSPEFPVGFGGKGARIDILVTTSDRHKYMLIECKRHHPEYSSWIFLKPESQDRWPYTPPGILGFGPKQFEDFVEFHLGPPAEHKTFVVASILDGLKLETAYMALAVKEQRQQQKNYRTEDIGETCERLVRATHGLFETLYRSDPMKEDTLFIPVVVTTAKLCLAEIDSSKSSALLEKGELSKEALKLTCVPRLVFEYSIPSELQLNVNLDLILRHQDRVNRRHILIVNSEHLEDFMKELHNALAQL